MAVSTEVTDWSIFLSQHVDKASDTLSWTRLDLLTSGTGCVSRLWDMWSTAWPQALSRPRNSHCFLLHWFWETILMCVRKHWALSSTTTIVFSSLRGEGGLTAKQSGGRNRHTRGLVATSFMRRSGAFNPSVIEFIIDNIFTTHCQVIANRMKHRP